MLPEGTADDVVTKLLNAMHGEFGPCKAAGRAEMENWAEGRRAGRQVGNAAEAG